MLTRIRTSGLALLAAVVTASLACLPADVAKALDVSASGLSTRLFLGRINNWMIWEFDGNDGRFCFMTSSPEGISPLKDPKSELWVTERPVENDDGLRDHVFEVSFRSDKIIDHNGRFQIEFEGQIFKTVIKAGDRVWLDIDAQAVNKLLENMIDLEAGHDDKKRRDPRSQPTTPILEIHGVGGEMPFVERFSVLGFAEAKAVIDEHCAAKAGPA